MEHNKDFSIIIPVWHAGDALRNALNSLRELDYAPELFEVVVAVLRDDAQSREIIKIAASDAPFDLHCVVCTTPQRSAMLNAACAASAGHILVFSDDDCLFRKTWLSELREVFLNGPELGIVGGQDVLESKKTSFALALDYVLQSFIGTGGLRRGTGPRTGKYYPRLWNMAFPRRVALDVALPQIRDNTPQIFDESMDVYEDMEIAQRVERSGKKVSFAPQVLVGHMRDTTFWRFVQRGFEKAYTSRRLGTLRFSHCALSAFVLCVTGLFIASFFSRQANIVFWGACGTYICVLLLTGIRGAVHTRNVGVIVLIPLLIFSLHVSRGLGYLFPFSRLFARMA